MLLCAPGFAGTPATAAAAETPPAALSPATTIADTVKEATASEDLQRAALARLEQSGSGAISRSVPPRWRRTSMPSPPARWPQPSWSTRSTSIVN